MFRIRRIYDDILDIDRKQISEVLRILREQFHLLSEKDVAAIPDMLRNPLAHRFRAILFVADDLRQEVKGFALMLHAPNLRFCYLDYISASPTQMNRGVGGALYQRVREEALALEVIGIFFECLPDDPRLCRDPKVLKQNIARLRFYERYGARPIMGTAYETPLKPEHDNPPYLVFDDLSRGGPLPRHTARSIVRAILESKYGKACPPGYINMVVASFQDDPVRLREPLYTKNEQPIPVRQAVPPDRKIHLVVNESHFIHHVKEKGYAQSPVRIKTILLQIESTGLFQRIKSKRFSEKHILDVHDRRFVSYVQRVCADLEPGESVYPYVFPIRNAARPPKDLAVRAGYYCLDTFTPLNKNAYLAARGAVDCALSTALSLLQGKRLAYALVRPPGHHAERKAYGGFCYFNSAAIAAHYLSRWGRVAVVDLDYHHGNGTQDIFYERNDVLTVSLHGHPRFAYPYFSGYREETGSGPGKGYNINCPLPETLSGPDYLNVLGQALRQVRLFRPSFLVIPLGLDTSRGDPTGSWTLAARDFESMGRMMGSLRLPTLVIQEGGYNHRNLGRNARHFFDGLYQSAYAG
jgi:acetoin utilization deacetylase AcuC-like enzyme/GNAT superfamily N-acetyltransferase